MPILAGQGPKDADSRKGRHHEKFSIVHRTSFCRHSEQQFSTICYQCRQCCKEGAGSNEIRSAG